MTSVNVSDGEVRTNTSYKVEMDDLKDTPTDGGPHDHSLPKVITNKKWLQFPKSALIIQ